MKAHGLANIIKSPSAHDEKGLSLKEYAAWYGGAEAQRIADIAVSFQTPAGGWGKNMDFTKHTRAPGEHFAPDNGSHFLVAGDNDAPHDANWSYVGTFDNNATITQLLYLAKVISAAGTNDVSAWRKSFLRGLDYVFAAQYPNGGWPQVWPLEGGYHDTITYNDDAMLNVLTLLNDIVDCKNDFTFVSAQSRAQAAASLKRGMDCLLATQIVVDGRRTVWCQQNDALTLQPASARNYEMPSLASGESGTIVLFLMELPESRYQRQCHRRPRGRLAFAFAEGRVVQENRIERCRLQKRRRRWATSHFRAGQRSDLGALLSGSAAPTVRFLATATK